MKSPYFLFIVMALFIISSCSKTNEIKQEPDSKEQPKPTPESEETVEPKMEIYFTANILPTYFNTDETDNWVIIHNEKGELVDFKPYEKGDIIEFEALNTDLESIESLVITNLIFDEADIDLFLLDTRTGVKKGSIWNFKVTTIHSPTTPNMINADNYNLTINNASQIDKYNIQSVQFGRVLNRVSLGNIDILKHNAIALQREHEFLFSVEQNNGILKYKFFEVPINGNDLLFDYNNFLDYDYILKTNLPEHNYYFAETRGYRTNSIYEIGYLFKGENSHGEILELKLPYLNNFEYYTTSIDLEMNKLRYGYRLKSTEIPNRLNIIDMPIFEIENSTALAFKFNTETNFVRYWAYWGYPKDLTESKKIRIEWDLFSDDSFFTLDGIPEEILLKHPDLDINNLEYRGIQLFTKEDSQIDFLKETVEKAEGFREIPNEREWLIINSNY